MLAAGMFTDLAAWIAERSRGLASASPPPCRAAMVISLMYLENSLPRAWSVAAFLRLMVAHLEWPDMEGEGASGVRPSLLLGTRCGDHTIRQLARHFVVVGQAGRVHAAALRDRAQVRCVLVGLRAGHQRADDLVVAVGFGAEDLAALRGQIPHDVPEELLGNADFQLVDRLEQHRIRLEHRLMEAGLGGDLERHFGRVHVVILAEEERHLNVHNRGPSERPALHAGDDPLLDRRDVLVGNNASLDLVKEPEPLAALERLEPEVNLSELAAPAGLLLVAVLVLGLAANRFA